MIIFIRNSSEPIIAGTWVHASATQGTAKHIQYSRKS